jgi:small membrane protein
VTLVPIIIFQIAAIVAVAVIAFFILRGGGARHQAIRRILLVLFVVGTGVSVFFPDLLTRIANLVGIGRGTDLLLYILVIAFLGFAATTYRRNRQLENDITELSRQIALLGADEPPAVRADTKAAQPKPKREG